MAEQDLVHESERLGQALVPIAEGGTHGRVNRELVAAIASGWQLATACDYNSANLSSSARWGIS